MNVKHGVKAFADRSEPLLPQQRQGDMPSNLTPEDLKKLGGENIGEVLNKIADANWVDPAKKMRTVGNDKLDKDAFFKLMLAQLKNQDPTNPLKPHEMSAQLANFSALEQMQNMNSTLTEMKAAQKPSEQYQALNLIGKSVIGDSAKIIRTAADKVHDITFTLPNDAAEVDVKIISADGDEVKKLNFKNLKKGENRISWNGQDERGGGVRPGEYMVSITAKGHNGTPLAVKTDFEGVISGVSYTPE
ncbi:MAG: flagellar hook assembly protein FlgD, partial [Bdellovibrionaceae bacterium]|nr:flagellar hook assembly protein FlgD [Pseudobdellovibrionaceae bacterium]